MCINSIIVGKCYVRYLFNEKIIENIYNLEGLIIENEIKRSISINIIILIIIIFSIDRNVSLTFYKITKIRRFNISSYYNIISYKNINIIRWLIIEIEKGIIEYIENNNISRLHQFSLLIKYDNSSILILFVISLNIIFFKF